MPTEADPDDGIIVTANQAVVPKTYPYHLTDDWDYGYRSQQILDRIRAAGKLDVNSMAAIQLDTKNRNAEALVPYLLNVQINDEFDRQGQDTLRNWDFTQPADSAPAAYFNIVWRNLLELTFHDQLPEGDLAGRRFALVRGDAQAGRPAEQRLVGQPRTPRSGRAATTSCGRRWSTAGPRSPPRWRASPRAGSGAGCTS